MCGIVGILGPHDQATIHTALQAMCASISHRGPDDEGLWAEDGFGFGMRRLSIIDLAGGSQPMWDDVQGLGVVYNGEVYNYTSLKQAMPDERFTTTSDTEVVLKSLARKWTKAPCDWNGMFGVAAWKRYDKKLLLIRDRLGIKPLYYSWDGKTLVFASEIKAILACGLVMTTINEQALWDFLTFRYVPGPQTIWKGILKLSPGSCLLCSPTSEPTLTRYWSLNVEASTESFDVNTAEDEFAELFLDSVNTRLVAADVPVGILLSGGLDSSAVAASAVELGHKNFHTFSVGYEEKEHSELQYARMMAEHIGSQHHEVRITRDDFMRMLPSVVYAQDEPLADLASVPLLAVSRCAREHVKVVLSGEGSDEILAGYHFDRLMRVWDRIRMLQRIPKPFLHSAATLLAFIDDRKGESLRRIARIPLSEWNRRLLPSMTDYFSHNEKSELVPGFTGRDSLQHTAELYSHAGSKNPLDQILSVYQQCWLVEDLLMKADKITMAASLELRVPFLDYRLVEWANRQPAEIKVGSFGTSRYSTKTILRRFAEKRIPATILHRPKQGFPVPTSSWISETSFRETIKTLLLGSDSSTSQYLAKAPVEKLFERAANGDRGAGDKIWLLLVLELWMRAYA